MKLTLGLGAFLLTVLSSDARPTFVARVPNGNGVTGVVALGHVNTAGGGATNAFGEAFEAAGYEWTKELCQADSDRDGASNGEELGDPCCTWTSSGGFDSASPSAAQSSPTHPGVADSFTESQLASMTCGGEADVSVIASSGTASSTSMSASGSHSSLFKDNSSTSGSSDDVVAVEEQPRVSSSSTIDEPSPTSATSDAHHLKTFVYCFSIAFVLAAS